MNTQHLNDEQFSDLLAGETPGNFAALHLEECVVCREELTSMQTAVGDLRVLSLRWAEERAPRITVPSRWTLGWQALPGWSTAAMLLLFGVALGTHIQSPVHSAPTVSQSQTVSAPTQDELAQDNRLLQSIDQELNQEVRPQVPASELTVSTRDLRHPRLQEVVY
jgi:hypothetical protein